VQNELQARRILPNAIFKKAPIFGIHMNHPDLLTPNKLLQRKYCRQRAVESKEKHRFESQSGDTVVIDAQKNSLVENKGQEY
jgi:hypothetical protein